MYKKRLDSRAQLQSEIQVWEQERNLIRKTIQWQFTTKKARKKMKRAYPV